MIASSGKPFRILSLDGGGMRGTYPATYLSNLIESFAKKRSVKSLDLGAAFNLIVGTSTGAIVGCALAAGIPLPRILDLYKTHGPKIFQRKVPKEIGPNLMIDLFRRPNALAAGKDALYKVLTEVFNDETLAQIYQRREIALAIPAVEHSQHRSWVFKTPHLSNTNHRDDDYSLVDVCLASSAAPIFRSLEPINNSNKTGYRVFSDGGLWANNPVLVGLIDALEMSSYEQRIEVFCLGTCPIPAGEQIPKGQVHRGLPQWKFGTEVAKLSINAQEFAYDNMARMLSKHLNRSCDVVRFPSNQVSADLMPYLDLDDTRPEAINALTNQALSDADLLNSQMGDPNAKDAQLIHELFMDAPAINFERKTQNA